MPHGVKSHFLSIIPSFLGFPTAMEAACSPETFKTLASLNDVSCPQNQHNLGNNTLPSLGTTMVLFEPQLLVLTLRK